jgi:hypothetical protein
MATIIDLIHRMQNLENDLKSSLGDIATSVSLTAKAIAERTIKESGFGAEYSTKNVPTAWLYGQVLNASGTSFLQQRDQESDELGLEGEASYKELRAAQGLQVAHVDLTYSGEMWRGMLPAEPEIHGGIAIAPLGHTNRDGQDKMNWNFERYGDFIGETLTGDNFDTLKTVAAEEVNRIIQRSNI